VIRILGIDWGERRHGLAVSDPMGYTAQPSGVVHRQGKDHGLEEIAEVIKDKEVTEIVVGLPFHMDGRPGDHHDDVLEFVGLLEERFGLPVSTVDERMTTIQAERALAQAKMSRKKRKGKVDQVAAQLILQFWLDSK
jgi:putative Holliday junction resolvase